MKKEKKEKEKESIKQLRIDGLSFDEIIADLLNTSHITKEDIKNNKKKQDYSK